MKRLWTALVVLLMFSVPAVAGELLFVPPDVFYLAGGEGEGSAVSPESEEGANQALCREYRRDGIRLLLDELGRSTYLAMSAAVATFNGSPEALRSRRHFRAQSMAYPSCRNNPKIKKFYRDLSEPGTPLLRTIKGKNGLDAIIWTDFRSRDVVNCLSGAREQCPVAATVSLFDGRRVTSSRVDQVFVRKNKKFTADSLAGLSREVERFVSRLGTPAQGE